MAPKLAKNSSRLIPILKWGGCFAALVFALGGLLMDLALSGETYETLGQITWMIVAVSMAAGFAGVVFDRAHEPPES